MPAWVWVCLLGQLLQFARVRLHPLLCLLDEMLREVEVRGGFALSSRLGFTRCFLTRNRYCIVSLEGA